MDCFWLQNSEWIVDLKVHNQYNLHVTVNELNMKENFSFKLNLSQSTAYEIFWELSAGNLCKEQIIIKKNKIKALSTYTENICTSKFYTFTLLAQSEVANGKIGVILNNWQYKYLENPQWSCFNTIQQYLIL